MLLLLLVEIIDNDTDKKIEREKGSKNDKKHKVQ